VGAGEFGFRQNIRGGPMRGRSHVVYWRERHGHAPADEVVDRIFDAAKRSDRLLEDEEMERLVRDAPH
jgi:hypothetical protein